MAANPIALGSLQGIGPASQAFTLTPHAANEMPPNRWFLVNADGTVAIRAVDSAADVSLTVKAGVIYPVSIRYLRVTGTTPTVIVGFN